VTVGFCESSPKAVFAKGRRIVVIIPEFKNQSSGPTQRDIQVDRQIRDQRSSNTFSPFPLIFSQQALCCQALGW